MIEKTIDFKNDIYHIKAMTTKEEFDNSETIWNDLYQKVHCDMPFMTFSWMRQWWDVFSYKPLTENKLLILLIYRNDQCLGIAPFFETFVKFSVFRYIRLLGADKNISEMRHILSSSFDNNTVLAVSKMFFDDHFKNWDLLYLTGMTSLSVENLLESKVDTLQTSSNFILELPDSFEKFRSTLRKNAKNNIRHCYNSLKKEGIEFEFEVKNSSEEIEKNFPEFCRLHALRSNQKDTVYHPDYFSCSKNLEFVKSVVKKMGDNRQAAILCIKIAGKMVAMRIVFMFNKCLYLYYSGLDHSYKRYGVGNLLFAESVKYALSKGLNKINLSFGEDRSKTRWRPERVEYFSAHIVNRGLRSKLTTSIFLLAKDIVGVEHNMIKQALIRTLKWGYRFLRYTIYDGIIHLPIGREKHRKLLADCDRVSDHTYTCFYRSSAQLDAFFSEALFQIKDIDKDGLVIRNFASSNGAEAYTFASEMLLRRPDINFKIYGSDLHQSMVDKALSRTYSLAEIQQHLKVPKEFLSRTFDVSGDSYVVKQAIAEKVAFKVGDLLNRNEIRDLEKADIIIAQNVLFHMPPDMARQAFENIMLCAKDRAVLLIEGMDLDLKVEMTQKNNLIPLTNNLKNIYQEARSHFPADWWNYYFGCEPYYIFEKDKEHRYGTMFLINQNEPQSVALKDAI